MILTSFLSWKSQGRSNIADAIRQFEKFANVSLAGTRVHFGHVGRAAARTSGNVIVINELIFNKATEDIQLRLLGHEFWHVIQYRTVPRFELESVFAVTMNGYNRSPYEITAAPMGAAFASSGALWNVGMVSGDGVEKIRYGVVPRGFEQYWPASGPAPNLSSGVEYAVSVQAGAIGVSTFRYVGR